MSGNRVAVEFRVLGPVEVTVASRLVPLTGKQRSLLAVLLLNADRVVSLGSLADAIWGRPAPASPDTRVRMLVSELRKALTAAAADLIVTRPPGYLIRTEPGQLDVATFLEFAELARRSAESGHADRSISQCETALSLWRGAALGGVTGPFAETEALRLEELRLGVLDTRSEGMLALGRHSELIADLGRLTSDHPLRERTHAHLVVALHHSGRRADALEVYRTLRERLVDELGLEPAPHLRQLQQQILTEQETPRGPSRAPAARPPMRQLPSDMAQFVGRRAELDRLDALSAGATRLLVIAGAAGAGKTALAVHWAHQAELRYPDGQFFLDMRGFDTGSQVSAAEALPQLLLALGVAVETIPVSLDAQAGLYRSLLAEHRLLIVLDNVCSPDQVRPLLPGGSGCLVVVTSRDRLGGLVALDGARRLTLDVLSPSEAHDVLARTMGATRLTSEPEAADDLARLCGYLPLALRIIAARLADQPHRTLRSHARELACAGRLAFLRIDDDARSNVRGAFDLSYQALPTPARRMFRLLGLVPAPGGLSSAAAAALAAVPIGEAEHLLDRLARLHLVRSFTADRYACHDLLLEFAAELACADDRTDRDSAVSRLLTFYLATVDRAGRLLTSPAVPRLPLGPVAEVAEALEITDAEQARRWLDLDWENLVAGVRHAAASGPRPMAWHLADALDGSSYLFPGISRPEWKAIVETALSAALAENAPDGEAAMRRHLGVIHWHMAEFPEAIEQYSRAAQLFRRTGWRQGELAALRGRGAALAQLGRTREAIELFESALSLAEEIDDVSGRVSNLNNLAAAWVALGEPDRAADYLAAALPLLAEPHRFGHEIWVYGTLGLIRYEQGRPDEASAAIIKSLTGAEALGDQRLKADALVTLGAIHCDAGRYAAATDAFTEVLSIARQTHDPLNEILALNGLAGVDIHRNRPGDAIERLRAAQSLSVRTNYHLGHAGTLALLAEAHHQLGHRHDAAAHAELALGVIRDFGPFSGSAEQRAARILADRSSD
ncbi:AfsR/SARP family transcriptional regulator [Actinacidiphila paucisporea]|uniref:AfsR/SARP family transcriptional regulator n=1 Tax=Actinacidiphila paucisporea TaxID=310782 RepID=UPI0013564197|nr:BTAD domain-containing putative transcriptional regulator [Actinacidiphila paucisporea]